LITLELILLLHIEDWTFFEKSIYFIAITFSVLISLHAYTPKTQKHLLLLFPVKFANQYLQLLMGSTTFSVSKGTTVDLIHLRVISDSNDQISGKQISQYKGICMRD
jgi:hypothetical protein